MRHSHVLVVAVAAVFSGKLAFADDDYGESHDFVLRPGGNVVPQVKGFLFQHVWIVNQNPDSSVWGAFPTQQGTFAPFDSEIVQEDGMIRQMVSRNLLKPFEIDIPPVGGRSKIPPLERFLFGGHSKAGATFNIEPFGGGDEVSGNVTADGFACADDGNGSQTAYAFSYSAVFARGGRTLRNGVIEWSPTWVSEINAQDETQVDRNYFDPINVIAVDLETGEIFEDTLLAINSRHSGAGTVSLDKGVLTSADVKSLEFSIEIDSPFTLQQGVVNLVIQDGLIAVSEDSGMYDGLLPPVGASSDFVVDFGDFAFDYDLGDFSGHDADITIDFSGGSSVLSAIPSPSTFVVLTIGSGWVGGRRKTRCSTPCVPS